MQAIAIAMEKNSCITTFRIRASISATNACAQKLLRTLRSVEPLRESSSLIKPG